MYNTKNLRCRYYQMRGMLNKGILSLMSPLASKQQQAQSPTMTRARKKRPIARPVPLDVGAGVGGGKGAFLWQSCS